MILVSGPTGSGKSTTLYAAMKCITSPQKNIIAIEDPVEYRTSSIRQVQVNPEANLTFASGLRSMLRQDPDVIMDGFKSMRIPARAVGFGMWPATEGVAAARQALTADITVEAFIHQEPPKEVQNG